MGRKKPKRIIQLMLSPKKDGTGLFSVTERKKTQYYTFWEIPCDIGGRGFALFRLDRGDVYHVRIGPVEDCSCECLGFLAHSHCRHIETLLQLEADGLV
jgi:hypothetical protein